MRDKYQEYNDDEVAMVSIELEDGTELECVVIGIFEAGNEGREYIAVMPENSDDDGEVFLYRYEEDEDGEPQIGNIESDEEYEIVEEAFDEILDEQEYMESVGEEDDGLGESDKKFFY